MAALEAVEPGGGERYAKFLDEAKVQHDVAFARFVTRHFDSLLGFLEPRALLKAGAFEVSAKIEAAQKRLKDLERALEEAGGKLAAAQSGDLMAQARSVGAARVLAVKVQGDAKALRELADKLRDKLGSGVIALGAEVDGKAVLLVAVTRDLTGKLKAGDLVREAAKLVGGAGGGKPDLAQAGGADPSGLPAALEKVQAMAAAALG
jgi:alanyl-tRNA synthetase